jgi:hypothetical protein
MTRAVAAPPSLFDPVTRRLLLPLPAALLAHDLDELIGNDRRPPPATRTPSLLPDGADCLGSKRPIINA